MKQFAMKTNSDQQQRMNATQVSDLFGFPADASFRSFDRGAFRSPPLLVVTCVIHVLVSASVHLASAECANEKVEGSGGRVEDSRAGHEGEERVRGGVECETVGHSEGIGERGEGVAARLQLINFTTFLFVQLVFYFVFSSSSSGHLLIIATRTAG